MEIIKNKMAYTSKDIENRIKSLPQDIQNAVLDAKLPEKLNAIGLGHGLHVDQIGTLMDDVNMVMLGLISPDSFNSAIMKELNLPAEKANALVVDVNEQILRPIRESLKKVQGGQMGTEEAEEPEKITDEEIDALIRGEGPATPEEALKSAGVEVLSVQPKELKIPSAIMGEKFAGAYRMPKKETDLSISKAVEIQGAELPSPGIAPSARKIDPYREIPK